ncbi:hypothetical protein [Erythrobacter sp.]|uniref:hypothetical protein n=1 Tax=Erythrobacter sp. TaxID=1042 RepID=UPI00326782B7
MLIKSTIKTVLCAVLASCTTSLDSTHQRAPNGDERELYDIVLQLDAVLFEQGFNQCNMERIKDVTAAEFEFYHDLAGTNGSKASFVDSLDRSVCDNDYRAHRRLLPHTMVVFPMYNGDRLYGAIQTATHEFYAIHPDGREELTDTARLFTLWIKTENGWRMQRSFSYDHVSY